MPRDDEQIGQMPHRRQRRAELVRDRRHEVGLLARQRDLPRRHPVKPIGRAERHQDGGRKPQQEYALPAGRALGLVGHDRGADDERHAGIAGRKRQAAGAAMAHQRLAFDTREGNGQTLRLPDRTPRRHDIRAAQELHGGLCSIGDPHRQYRRRALIDQTASAGFQLTATPGMPERVGRFGAIDGSRVRRRAAPLRQQLPIQVECRAIDRPPSCEEIA